MAHASAIGLGMNCGVRGLAAVGLGCLCGLRTVTFAIVGGGIATVVVMVAVGVVLRVHRTRLVAGRRHRRTESVVIVAVVARTVVVSRAGTYVNDHPAFVARSFPVEGDGFEVFEGGEAVQLVAHLIVRHDGEGMTLADAVGWDVDGDSLDAAWTYLHPFLGIAVAFVRVEIEANVTPVGVVANILDVIVDCDGVGVVDHHGL